MNRTLYTYFRSSAAYRVRIAMNLKGLQADPVYVHLNRNGGEQYDDAYKAVNPQALVPALVEDGMVLSQSLAIIEYLDEQYTDKPLLPKAPIERAHVRQLALGIACDIHPLNNLRVLKYLSGTLGVNDAQTSDWIANWITLGLQAVEAELARHPAGRFCFGDTPTVADCCLVPQVFSAQRFSVDLSACPWVLAVYEHCQTLPAFIDAQPGRQPDAE